MPEDIQTRCLCGKTSLTIAEGTKHDAQAICHCLDCKVTSGSPFSSNVLVPTTDLKFEGLFKSFDIKVNTNTVSRIFCSNCGSALAHSSTGFIKEGVLQTAVQTGNIKHFATVPIAAELFTKDRWPVLAPVAGAFQNERM